MVWKLPIFLKHKEASILPAATFVKMKNDDTILIHAASGGVGLTAA